jgi:hypothetical protein
MADKTKHMGASPAPSRHRWLVALACTGLLLLFVILAWLGVRGRSATFDEPVHVAEAWVVGHQHDFRVDPENPVLWLYWAALAQPAGAMRPAESPYWPLMLSSQQRNDQLALGRELLYRTPGLDADALVNRSRAMMLVVAVALGGVIGWWSWKLGGGVAAIAATMAFALDPNFLAHGPLVKNDLAIALLTAAILMCTWLAGQRLTVANALGLAVLSGAALVTKFSAIVLVLIPPALLVGRAVVPWEWMCFGRAVASRGRKLLVAAGLVGLIAVASYVIIWGTYAFRFGPVPGSDALLPTARLIEDIRADELYAAHPDRAPTTAEMESWRPPLKVRAVLLVERHRLLPQTWLHGLLFTHRGSLLRPSFLCGRYSQSGFALYYPLTFLFKTPLATLAALLLAMALGVSLIVRRSPLAKQSGWAAACLGVPVVIYGVASMTTVLDLGVRYLLPIYPLLFIAIGCAAAHAWRRWHRRARLVLAALGLALAVETLAGFPNFIPFFNAACGGARGGLELLGDSNLDWGQDLKGLAQWWRDYQRRGHPDSKLYLSYFGNSSPRYYGLRFTSLPGNFAPADESDGPPRFPASGPALLAIGATNLQGIYFGQALREPYAALRKERPIAVIGGSIYIYELP